MQMKLEALVGTPDIGHEFRKCHIQRQSTAGTFTTCCLPATDLPDQPVELGLQRDIISLHPLIGSTVAFASEQASKARHHEAALSQISGNADQGAHGDASGSAYVRPVSASFVSRPSFSPAS